MNPEQLPPAIQIGTTLSGTPMTAKLPLLVMEDEAQLYFGGITGHGKTSMAKLLDALPTEYSVQVEDGRG